MSRRSSPPETTIDNETRYCICQKREDEFNEDDKNDFMIECDGCSGWFHGRCIGLADRIAGKNDRSMRKEKKTNVICLCFQMILKNIFVFNVQLNTDLQFVS